MLTKRAAAAAAVGSIKIKSSKKGKGSSTEIKTPIKAAKVLAVMPDKVKVKVKRARNA